MRALILSGGRGSRLKPLTHTSTKQLLPVAGKPILFHTIEKILEVGIKDIGIIISPQTGHDVINAVENSEYTANFKFIWQEEPLGLAHAVLCAKKFLKKDDFIMCLGDNLFQDSLHFLINSVNTKLCNTSIILKKVYDPERFGVAVVENENIISLEEKPKIPKSDLAVIGIYKFDYNIFEAINNIFPSKRGELEIIDAIQWQLTNSKEKNLWIKYDILSGWWFDLGKKDSLLEANALLLKDSYVGINTKIINSKLDQSSSIGDNCIITNSTIKNSILMDNVEIYGCNIHDSIIGNNCSINNLWNTDPYELMLADDSKIE